MEAKRDSIVAVSAEMDLTKGGRPIDLQANPIVPRRTVYGFINRDIVSNFASTFDAANPNACTAKRPDTTVPQQTLFALNSEFIQDRAARLASLAESNSADAKTRVRWLYQRLFAREPQDAEIALAIRFVTDNAQADTQSTTAWQQLAHVLLASNEFIFLD